MNSHQKQTIVQKEAYISVDIEAAGPVPGEYSMLSLGACLVNALEVTFYGEFRPINDRYVSAALKVSGLTLEQLAKTGHDPAMYYDVPLQKVHVAGIHWPNLDEELFEFRGRNLMFWTMPEKPSILNRCWV